MTLARRLAKLEIIVKAEAPPAWTWWTPEHIEQWIAWAIRFLEAMPRDRAERVYSELTTLPADQHGSLTRHVHVMAVHAVMGAWNAYLEQGRPLALPEAVCVVLEGHPDADVRSAYDCENCGFETPVRSAVEWRRYCEETRAAGREVDPSDRALLTVCPLCGGAVTWQGFNSKRWRALWEQQKAEMAAGR